MVNIIPITQWERMGVPLELSLTSIPASPIIVIILTPSSLPLPASPAFSSSFATAKRISIARSYWGGETCRRRAVVVSAF